MAQKFLSGLQATIGSVGTPGISFVGYADTGLYRTTYDTTKDALDFAIDGVRRGRIFEAGIEAFGNLYFSGDVRTFGSLWHATTGATGVGFAFTNTADSTDALTLSSTGTAVFGGTVTANGVLLTGDQTLPTDFVSKASGGTFENTITIADTIDGDFTALRLMNQKTYGSGTGTNERVRFVMGLSESGIAITGREGFAIDFRIAAEGDSSDGIVDFKVRDGGTLGTYSTVTGSNKSVSFVGNVIASANLNVNSTLTWAKNQASSYTYSAADATGMYIERVSTVGAGSAKADIRLQARDNNSGAYNVLRVKGSDNTIRLTSPNTHISGALSVVGAISASNLSGTNTGDQTTISGNAATATNVAYTGITGTTNAYLKHPEGSKHWTGINAAGAQAKKYHLARLFGAPAHWSGDWQNIEILATALSYESGTVKYCIVGDYAGVGTQAGMIKVYLKDKGGLAPRFKITTTSPVDAGWDHSGQDVFYVDVYVEVAYYTQWEISMKSYGHGLFTAAPTSGGSYTQVFTSPTVSNTTDFSDAHLSPYFGDKKIWNEGNDGAGSGLDADLLDGQQGSYYTQTLPTDFVSKANGGTFGGAVTISGNLTVNGTQTILNTSTLDVEDINITVGKLATTSALTNGAGLTFGAWSSGTTPQFYWHHANNTLAANKSIQATRFYGPLTGDVTGNVSGNCSGNAATATLADDAHYIKAQDNRIISPSEHTTGKMRFGFTSWHNNNSSPYADFLHMRSYSDNSGGADNLVMFKKSGIGMRIWQQAYGSSTAYASYENVYSTPYEHKQNNTDVDSGATRIIAEIIKDNHHAIFFDYLIKKGTNVRAGTLTVCHDGTLIEYAETSTVDLGDTNEVVLSASILNTKIRLIAETVSNDWSIKSLIRAI